MPGGRCPRCGRPRDGGGNTYCKRCNLELNAISRAKRPQIQALLHAKANPCIDCGVELPVEVMELDHVRGSKMFPLTQSSVMRRPLDKVLAEIAKCEVRCPNHHRMRHYRDARGL